MAERTAPIAGQTDVATQVPSPSLPRDSSANATGAWGPLQVLTPGMTFREIGVTGLRAFGGWVREEFLPNLVGRQGAQKFREMRDNSPTIGGILSVIEATLRKVEWRVEPADDSAPAREMAEFVEQCMDDMTGTWEDTVAEALSMVTFGFAPLELVYKKRLGSDPGEDPDNPGEELPKSKYDDGKVAWRRMPLRSQDTILKWFFDVNGQARGLTQQPWTGPLIDIPLEKMLLFRARPFKNNPEGLSVLRNSYVPFYYSKRMQEQEAILAERLGGVPVIYIPSSLLEAASRGDARSAAVVEEYRRIARNVRIDEQMGLVLPSDMWTGANGPSGAAQYRFELVTPQHRGGSGFDFDKTITRYNVQMMTSTLTDFLQLGHEARGTQSLALSKTDMFFQAIEGWLNSMGSTFDRYAVTRLWRLNDFDDDLMPKIQPDLAQRVDLDVLSNFVLRLSQAGMPLFPDEELESYIRDAGGMPDVADERALQVMGMTDEQIELERQKEEEALAQTQARTEQMQNPPQPQLPPPGKQTPLQKMIAASWARRQRYYSGPRFGVSTKKRHRHRKPARPRA